jgi:dTDP-4-dehydrorhamnose reductase
MINGNSFLSAADEQENILSTYRADFNRYCGRAGTDQITRIFETTPKIIGNKVTYAKIDPDAQAQQIKRAINRSGCRTICRPGACMPGGC